MIEKIYKYFFYFFILIFALALIILTFNSNLRRTSLNYLVNAYKVYMIISLQTELKKVEPNFSNINKKLNNYIVVSNKIANGKSKILIGIYDSARLVQTKVIDFKDHGLLEEFNKNLIEIDPLMYSAKIWYAKSLFANNKIDQAIKQINEAIKISPIDAEPYRLGIKIASKLNDDDLLIKFCRQYLNSEFGGQVKRYKSSFFTGFNLNKFGIKFSTKQKIDNDKNIYTHNGITLGIFDTYEIVPIKPVNIENLSLFFTFNAGTSLEIRKITLFSENKKEEILVKDTTISSNNSFFSSQNTNLLFFSKDEDEIIEIKLNELKENIQKILIDMRIKKMSIINQNCKI